MSELSKALVERAAQAFIDAGADFIGEGREALADQDERGREVLLVCIAAALTASRLDEAREALEPFAKAADALPSWARGHNTLASYPGFCGGLDADDLRRARTALDKLRGE